MLDPVTGAPDFERLRGRLPAAGPRTIAAGARAHPVTFVAWDGRSTRELSYRERREVLEDLGLQAPCVKVPESFGPAASDLHAATAQHGLEGVVFKRVDAPYTPGRRLWRKGQARVVSPLTVTGWAPASAGELETLYLARRGPDGSLRRTGSVQYGLGVDGRRTLRRALAWHELRRQPTRIRNVVAGLEVDVAHHGGERALRDPVIRAVIFAGETVA